MMQRHARSKPNSSTPGEGSATRPHVQKIKASWRKAVESIIETGRLLIEAKAELAHGQFEEMIKKQLPFHPRTAQMLMRIAEHPVLVNPKFISHLPASWGTLYELSHIPEQELLPLIEDGTVNPDTTRKDVARLGFNLIRQAPNSLFQLIELAEHYPDPDRLVPDLIVGDWSLVFARLAAFGKLPEWLAGLHKALVEHDEKQRRRMEECFPKPKIERKRGPDCSKHETVSPVFADPA